jgi:hypothetical protein
MPNRVFSGREHPTSGPRAVFFCYARPARTAGAADDAGEAGWSIEAGDVQWYLYDLATEKIVEEPTEILGVIRSAPDTRRRCVIGPAALSENWRQSLPTVCGTSTANDTTWAISS